MPFQIKFLEAGTYNYRCQIYTRMRGRIEVCDKTQQVSVVKSVNQISKMVVTKAAIPSVYQSYRYNPDLEEQKTEQV